MAIRLLLVAVVAAVAFGIQATLPRDSAEAGSAPANAGSEGIAQQPAAFPLAQDGGIAGNGPPVPDPENLKSICSFFLDQQAEDILRAGAFDAIIGQGKADLAAAEFEGQTLGATTDLDNLVNGLQTGILTDDFGLDAFFALLQQLCEDAVNEEPIDSGLGQSIANSIVGNLPEPTAGAAGSPPGASGGPTKLTVNSDLDVGEAVAFQGDGFCDITGSAGLGPCTLRAAIQEANAASMVAGTINFDPAFFPPASQITPTTIHLATLLPFIAVDDLTIDTRNARVAIDADDLAAVFVVIGAVGPVPVALPNYDFSLTGRPGTLIMYDMTGAGVVLASATNFDRVNIDHLTIANATAQLDPTPSDPTVGVLLVADNTRTLQIADNVIRADTVGVLPISVGAGAGLVITTSKWHITGNTIVTGAKTLLASTVGVLPIITGALATDVTININNNPKIGTAGPGVALLPIVAGTAASDTVTINMNDNGQIKANQAEVPGGLSVAALPIIILGCGPGAPFFTPKCNIDATINMNGNTEVAAVDDFAAFAYLPFTIICCGSSDSTSVQRLDDNDAVLAESPAFGIAAAFFNFVCCGDDNKGEVSASRNGRIFGDDVGVFSLNFVSDPIFGLPVDDNIGISTFDANRTVEGEDLIGIFPVQVVGAVGGGADAETNSSRISVSDTTGIINGGVAGIFALGFAGATGVGGEGDDGTSTIHVDRNFRIIGEDEATVGFGVVAIAIAGGPNFSSDDNTTLTTLNRNGGISSQEGPAIGVLAIACCGDDNTNVLEINENTGAISGEGGVGDLSPGIGVVFCCSTNNGTIQDNEGNISGSGLILGAGIGILAIPENPIPLPDPNRFSLTNVDITDNSLTRSEEEGIIVCCGLWHGSQFSENLIAQNGQSGVFIVQASGITVGPENEIRENGTGTGVTLCCSSIPSAFFALGANYNRITQNSIFDNVGLGIDHTLSLVTFDAVSCQLVLGGPLVFIGTGPNTCLPFPGFPDPYIVSNGILTGQACPGCIVEIFEADGDPPDQCTVDGCFGEGRRYVRSITADAVTGTFSATLPCGLAPGFLTVTGTRLQVITLGGSQVPTATTSEFSENVPITGSPSCATATPTVTNTFTPAPATATFTPAPPTATPTPVTPVITKACGDVNDSGSVNAVDAQLLLQFKAALIPSLPNPDSADVNGDGTITSVDAALILQKEAGLIPALTGC